jgi:hypothetical protein
VVHVATTTIAPVQDGELTERIHDDLARWQLAPAVHVVDSAYVTPARIERARRVHGIDLLGPIEPENSWQARSGNGFGKSAFTVDWDKEQVTCPQGTLSRKWGPCGSLVTTTSRSASTRPPAGLPGPRAVHLLRDRTPVPGAAAHPRTPRDPGPQPPGPARRGMAGTLRDPRRRRGHPLPERPHLRPAQTRYRGLPRAHVQHVLTALACNLTRVADWIAAPDTTHRRSTRFHALCITATA